MTIWERLESTQISPSALIALKACLKTNPYKFGGVWAVDCAALSPAVGMLDASADGAGVGAGGGGASPPSGGVGSSAGVGSMPRVREDGSGIGATTLI